MSVAFHSSYIISGEDVAYNLDAFESGSINLALVLGFSGSGKSTLAKEFANKHDAEFLELDAVLSLRHLKSDSDFLNDWRVGYYKSAGYGNADEFWQSVSGKREDEAMLDMTINFIDDLEIRAEREKNKKFVLEGIWPVVYGIPPSHFENWAILIKGTSFIKSLWRSTMRDANTALERFKLFFGSITSVREMKKYCVNINRNISAYQKYFSNRKSAFLD